MLVITGGAGFIGSALLWEFNRLGLDEIVVVDNLAETEKWRNLVKRQYVDYLHRDRFYDLLRRDAPAVENQRRGASGGLFLHH